MPATQTYKGRADMQQGMYRDIPFGVRSQDTDGGRRVVNHEYPGRDEPWAEDLGRKARTHNLEMILVGSDYMVRRDKLVAALEEGGVATLVHPWLGRMQVQMGTYRLRESTREGGQAIITVTYHEAGRSQFPNQTVDTASEVAAQASVAQAAVDQDFTDKFDVNGQPQWVADDAVSLMGEATATITGLAESLPAVPEALTNFYTDVTKLDGALNTLVRSPYDAANGIQGIVSGLAGIVNDPLPSLELYKSLGLFGSDKSKLPTTTPANKAKASNQAATIAFVQATALIEESKATALSTPASSADALLIQQDLAARLDEAASVASDTVYIALMDLRAAVVRDMTARAAQLPQRSFHQVLQTQPSIVLAYRIYGDTGREPELVKRNHIAHPGFIAGGTSFEVIQ